VSAAAAAAAEKSRCTACTVIDPRAGTWHVSRLSIRTLSYWSCTAESFYAEIHIFFALPGPHYGIPFSRRFFLACSAKLPTGIYILPSVISFFIFFFNDFSENNYLSIHWTDFRNLYTK